MNFHSLAPKRYKRSVVSGFVHRIYRACSTWKHFHDSLEKAKRVLEQNQYPPEFYGPIIYETLTTIVSRNNDGNREDECYDSEDLCSDSEDMCSDREEESSQQEMDIIAKEIGKSFSLFLNYRGKVSESYARALHKINAPCRIIFTLRKLKTILPSLKPPVQKLLKKRGCLQD